MKTGKYISTFIGIIVGLMISNYWIDWSIMKQPYPIGRIYSSIFFGLSFGFAGYFIVRKSISESIYSCVGALYTFLGGFVFLVMIFLELTDSYNANLLVTIVLLVILIYLGSQLGYRFWQIKSRYIELNYSTLKKIIWFLVPLVITLFACFNIYFISRNLVIDYLDIISTVVVIVLSVIGFYSSFKMAGIKL